MLFFLQKYIIIVMDKLFNKPILIYSEYCRYSTNILQVLMKNDELYHSFIRMNIDVNMVTKKRPELFYKIQEILGQKITKVPTIITPGAEYILSDKDAFKWLDLQMNREQEIDAFSKNEMISFSDHYAKFGSTDLNDATEQSYKYFVNVNKNGVKERVLQNDNYLNTKKTWSENSTKTNGFLNDLEQDKTNIDIKQVQNERINFDINQNKQKKNNNPQKREMINFTDPNFGLSGQLGAKYETKREKLLDNKLSQLILEREEIDKLLQSKKRI